MRSLEELTTPLTTDEVKAAIYATLAASGTSTTTWKRGAVARTIIAGVSIVLSAFSELQALIARGGFLELAEEDWLTLVAYYIYRVERDQGSFGTTTLLATNTGGGVYTGDPGDLIVTNPATGKSYRNTEAYSIGALEEDVEIPVQAIEIGSASTSGPGTLTQLETSLLGVEVTNPTAIVGTDPESDPDLRTRCYEKTGTLSPNGPRDAYSFIARSAKRLDGTSIGVTRVRSVPDGLGGVDVYVATASGAVAGTVGNLATDLGCVDDAIQRFCTPLGITARVHSAAVSAIAITYELWVRSTTGMTSSQIQTAAATALASFFAKQPIGGIVLPSEPGRIYLESMRRVIASVVPTEAFIDLELTTPSAPVDLAVDEAPVLGTVTPTAIHFVVDDLAATPLEES